MFQALKRVRGLGALAELAVMALVELFQALKRVRGLGAPRLLVVDELADFLFQALKRVRGLGARGHAAGEYHYSRFQALQRVHGLGAAHLPMCVTAQPVGSFKPSSGYAAWEPMTTFHAHAFPGMFQALKRVRGQLAVQPDNDRSAGSRVSSPQAGTRPASHDEYMAMRGLDGIVSSPQAGTRPVSR